MTAAAAWTINCLFEIVVNENCSWDWPKLEFIGIHELKGLLLLLNLAMTRSSALSSPLRD
jgi:hypothetical protein